MLFLSAGAAAEDGIGRYQAVPIAPAANSAQSGEVLLIDTRDIDTRDGHVWKSRQFCHYFECQMRLAGAGSADQHSIALGNVEITGRDLR